MPKKFKQSKSPKRNAGKPKKEPFSDNLGTAGKRFQPSTFGDARGTEKGWAGTLPKP